MNHRLVQYSPEMEVVEAFQAGPLVARRSTSDAGAFNQAQVLELANEVLEARSEEARTRCFGRLIDRASRALARPVSPALARALHRALRRIGLHALPFTAGPLLNQPNAIVITTGKRDVARPSGQIISDAARLFGLELEGLSAEDQE